MNGLFSCYYMKENARVCIYTHIFHPSDINISTYVALFYCRIYCTTSSLAFSNIEIRVHIGFFAIGLKIFTEMEKRRDKVE